MIAHVCGSATTHVQKPAGPRLQLYGKNQHVALSNITYIYVLYIYYTYVYIYILYEYMIYDIDMCMYICVCIYIISIHEPLELDDAVGEDPAETWQGARQEHNWLFLLAASENGNTHQAWTVNQKHRYIIPCIMKHQNWTMMMCEFISNIEYRNCSHTNKMQYKD